MTPREAVLAALNHEDIRPVPFTIPMEEDVALRVTAHYGDDGWRQRMPQYMVGVFSVDTNKQTPISDTHVKDAYGGIWRTDRLPWHLEEVPLAEPSLDGYSFPKPEDFFRPDWKEQALKTCEETTDSFIVGHLGWGLFERCWNLRGFENILMDFIAEPDFVEEALDKLTDLYLAFVEYTADMPIDGILFGDDWGDQRGVIIGPERWRRFIKPRWAKIYEAVHSHGKYVMSHSCGSVAAIIPDLIEIGLDVLESVQPEAADMNPYQLAKAYGDKMTFWGGLGSQSTMPFGSPEDVAAEVRHLCAEVGKGGGYILAPAKPLQVETPTANAVALIEAALDQTGR